jgi:hypothetical protein
VGHLPAALRKARQELYNYLITVFQYFGIAADEATISQAVADIAQAASLLWGSYGALRKVMNGRWSAPV